MSKASFQRNYVKPLLQRLAEDQRNKVESLRGQIVQLNRDTIDDIAYVAENVYQRRINIPEAVKVKALNNARAEAKKMQARFEKKDLARFKRLEETAAKIGIFGIKSSSEYFIVEIFKTKSKYDNYSDSINHIKDVILNTMVESGALTSGRAAATSSRIQRGHGDVGEAVSEFQIARSLTGISTQGDKRDKFRDALRNHILQGGVIVEGRDNTILNLLSHYKSRVDPKGNIRNTYTSVVSFQIGRENTGIDATEERLLIEGFRKFLGELTPKVLGMKGSSSLKDKIEFAVSSAAVPKIKGKNVKVSKKIKKAELNTEASSKDKIKVGGGRGTYIKNKPIRDPKTGRFISKEQAQSPYNLLAILNAKLPDVVASHMHWPRLRYRTGRFASSVRATDVQTTPQGYPSIGYTYMKYPYQTFEVGYAQGTEERDPRPLIDMSIREIASTMAMGRFFTRRV